MAAVLYGVGARLDEQPELLFTLRGVDPAQLVGTKGLTQQLSAGGGSDRRIEGDLSSVFGIDIDVGATEPGATRRVRSRASAKASVEDPTGGRGKRRTAKPKTTTAARGRKTGSKAEVARTRPA